MSIVNLHNNSIISNDSTTLETSCYLTELDLSQNQLRTIRNGTFRCVQRLEKLNLECNTIESVEFEAFLGLNESLVELGLGKNSKIAIETYVFRNLVINRTREH